MKKPNFEQILIYGIAFFLSVFLSFIMDDLKLLGEAKYVYLIVGFVLFIIFVVVLQWIWSWSLFQKIKDKIAAHWNIERKADFQVSNLEPAFLNNNLYLFTVHFPKDVNPVFFLDVNVKIETINLVEKKDNWSDHIRSIGRAMSEMRSAHLLWRSNLKNKTRIWKLSSLRQVCVFEIDRDGENFGFYPLVDRNGFRSVLNKYGASKHSFRVIISAKDFIGMPFCQKLIYKVCYDGNILETMSITPTS